MTSPGPAARLLRVLRSPLTKWLFLLIALIAMAWFVVANATEIAAALSGMPASSIAASLAVSAIFVLCTLLSWRTILADLGSPLPLHAAIALFGVSQLGKYIPGGVWNVAAAAALGREHGIPAQRSVAAMTISILVSLVSGVTVGAISFLIAPAPLISEWHWVMYVGVAAVVILIPAVMNRLIRLAGRALRAPMLETSITTRGIVVATAWAITGWAFAGISVSFLAFGLGASPEVSTSVQAVGGYALAWVGGFLAVFAPAGVGVREVILGASFSGTLSAASVVALVLVSRLALTVVDLALAGLGAIAARQARRKRLHAAR